MQKLAVLIIIVFVIIIVAAVIFWDRHHNDNVDYHDRRSKETVRDNHDHDEKTYDFIICGAGTAGAIVAHNLGAQGFSVLVLERGLNQQDNTAVQDGAVPVLVAESNNYAQTYLQEPYALPTAPFLKRLEVISGKMIGGSSGVNYTVYTRPSEKFHEELAHISGDTSYLYDNYYKYYKQVEDFIGVTQEPQQRGEHGLISITQFRGAGTEFGEWLQQLGAVTGSQLLEDYNVGDDLVTSPYLQSSVLLREGQVPLRQWSSEYLNPAPKSVHVLTSAECLKVLFKKKCAIGVDVIQGHKKTKYYCKHEVIICAGIESSLILERSGIGNKDILKQYGIKSRIDNKHVGENFRNHGGVEFFTLMGQTVAPQALAPLFAHIPDGGYTEAGRRNVQVLFINTAYGVPVQGPTPVQGLIWNINPKVRGSMHITGPGIQQPVITYDNYEDLLVISHYIIDVLVPNLRLTGPEDLRIGPIINIPPELLAPGQYQHLAQWIYANQTPGAHYTGQCSIGTVVDAHLKVIGVNNLRVVDNSVFPVSVPCNTSASAQGIGFFASHLLLREYS